MGDIEQTLQQRSPGGEPSGEAERPETGQPSPDAKRPADGSSVAESGDAGSPAAAEATSSAGDEDAAALQGDLDELVKTAAERDEYLALAQRTQADFENYRKRVARESAAAHERGLTSLAKELLPALDNLDRALEEAAAQSGDGDDPLLAGVRLVRSELSAALARAGIESFSPAGETFDPALHEAVATVEQPADGCASGIVVEVYEPGYRLGASVIRAARVVVAA
jgi:molecular chaperone GrpE